MGCVEGEGAEGAEVNGRHTPGPWIFGTDSHEILTARGEGVAAPCDGYDEEQWLIDGPLIAATPDLLEALVMVRDADEDCQRDGLQTIPSSARARIDAAIAKAEGGAQ